MEAVIIEVVIAVVSLIASSALTYSESRSAEGRNSRETQVRKWYKAVTDRFGISLQQLDAAAEQLGIKLNNLQDATRGSARLSKASAICRKFVSDYPEEIAKINKTKRVIQEASNNLDKKANDAAGVIENRGTYSNQQILKDVDTATDTVNTAINGYNSSVKDDPDSKQVQETSNSDMKLELSSDQKPKPNDITSTEGWISNSGANWTGTY